MYPGFIIAEQYPKPDNDEQKLFTVEQMRRFSAFASGEDKKKIEKEKPNE